ncbi:MAG: T9SS type A sorting domain-containing protein [Candidatus Zixiibacteriota bacterium]
MKKILSTFLLFLALAVSARAGINSTPDYTFLWNTFNSVTALDSFAIATTREGVLVLAYDDYTNTYESVDNIFLNSEPFTQKLYGSVLAVRTYADEIYFLDVGRMPDVAILGKVEIDFPFHDFALHGQDLYICAGFEGLLRYSMINYKMMTFADSSMTGIHYTRVEVYGNELYALDDYNGLLRYDISGVGFGEFLDYLFIPFQATSFLKSDSTLIIASNKNKIMFGRFGHNPPVVQDTVDLMVTPSRILATDSVVIALDSSQSLIEVIDRFDLSSTEVTLLDFPDKKLNGAIARLENEQHILFPSPLSGLVLYRLSDITFNPVPLSAFLRPGPIKDVVINYSNLYTGGDNNPVDKYGLEVDSRPSFRYTIYSGLKNTSALQLSGDKLYVYYPKLHSALIYNINVYPVIYEGYIPVTRDSVDRILFNEHKIDTMYSFFAASSSGVDVFSVSDSGEVRSRASIETLDDILDIAAMDSLLIISTDKSTLWIYRIYDNFSVEFRSTIGLPFDARRISRLNDRLLVFSNYQLILFDINNPVKTAVDTSINIPLPVRDCALSCDRLYTIGDLGITVFDIVDGVPKVVDYGGRGGHIISAYEHIIGASNGYSIHMYDISGILTEITPTDEELLPTTYSLSQNYPNPFNPATTIEYTLPRRSRINLTVYNILGQNVATLVDREETAGRHTAEWDGLDKNGQPVASGVYFYRIKTDNYNESKKMILLK